MKLVVVTNASSIENEHEIIERMFRHGLKYLHVRKPKYSKEKMAKYLEKFSKDNRDKIIIHSHHGLALSLGLKGIHLTEKARDESFNVWKKFYLYRIIKPKLQITTSYHKLSDLKKNRQNFDYVFFSPVFDSISKEDHEPSYTLANLYDALNYNDLKVIALGGVNADKISVCYETRFSGVALSGYLWESGDPVEQFDKAKLICSQYKAQS